MADISSSFTDFDSLTDSEQKVIYCLVRRSMSSNEIVQATGISYSYLIRILKSLQFKRYVERVGSGKEFTYHLIRYPEKVIESGTIPELRITLGNEQLTLSEVFKRIDGFKAHMPELYRIFATIWIRSLRAERHLPQEEPNPFAIRYFLSKKIAELKILLSIAEQLANLPVWNDKPINWKLLHNTESPKVIQQREEVSRQLFERWKQGEFE